MKQLYTLILSVMLVGTMPGLALAHDEAPTEAQQGAAISQALQSGTKKCADLKDADFELMGEFFMDRMAGSSHDSMNAMMKQSMGVSGEEQMHEVIGKRMSGCDANAEMSAGMMGGMMNIMGGAGMMGGSGMMGAQNFGSMMRGLHPTGFVTLWYVVGILAAIALVLVIAKYLKELFK